LLETRDDFVLFRRHAWRDHKRRQLGRRRRGRPGRNGCVFGNNRCDRLAAGLGRRRFRFYLRRPPKQTSREARCRRNDLGRVNDERTDQNENQTERDQLSGLTPRLLGRITRCGNGRRRHAVAGTRTDGCGSVRIGRTRSPCVRHNNERRSDECEPGYSERSTTERQALVRTPESVPDQAFRNRLLLADHPAPRDDKRAAGEDERRSGKAEPVGRATRNRESPDDLLLDDNRRRCLLNGETAARAAALVDRSTEAAARTSAACSALAGLTRQAVADCGQPGFVAGACAGGTTIAEVGRAGTTFAVAASALSAQGVGVVGVALCVRDMGEPEARADDERSQNRQPDRCRLHRPSPISLRRIVCPKLGPYRGA